LKAQSLPRALQQRKGKIQPYSSLELNLVLRAPQCANHNTPKIMTGIEDILLIGSEVAIKWSDGSDS
jgi:hypothetical protein